MRIASKRVLLGDPPAEQPAELVIEGSRIVDVVAPSGGADEDLGELLIVPAFINAHTHLSMGAFRGLLQTADLRGNVVEDLYFRLESQLTAQDVRAFTRLGAYECLAHGVGMVWDHYYHGTAVAEALRDVGLCGVVAPTLQDLGGPGRTQGDAGLEATLALTGEDWGSSGIFAALGPHATDTVSATLWRRVSALATKHALPVHAHVAQSVQEFERIWTGHGCSPIELLHRLGVLSEAPHFLSVHTIFATDADLRRFDPARHTIGYCPLSQHQFCVPAYVPAWERLGLPWAVGTDAAASNDAMNVQRELVSVAGIPANATTHGDAYQAFRTEGGLTRAKRLEKTRVVQLEELSSLLDPAYLLSRVWSQPGRMHPGFTAGVIAPGALANLLVVDADHPSLWPGTAALRSLAFCDTSLAIERRMTAGQWRDVQAEVYAAHRTEAHERLQAHLAKL